MNIQDLGLVIAADFYEMLDKEAAFYSLFRPGMKIAKGLRGFNNFLNKSTRVAPLKAVLPGAIAAKGANRFYNNKLVPGYNKATHYLMNTTLNEMKADVKGLVSPYTNKYMGYYNTAKPMLSAAKPYAIGAGLGAGGMALYNAMND